MNVRVSRIVKVDLKQRTTYRFSLILKRLVDCLAEMHQTKFGITINGWKVMSVVGRFAPLAAVEVGQFVSLEPDRVTRTVDVLVKQGIVARRQDKQDRRRISLSLTAKGKRIQEQIERVRYALEYEFLSVLDDTELETLYRILDKLEPQAKSIFTSDGAWQRIVNKYDADSFKKLGL
jgi:DNA-binding MarR family transcriptional regulator